MTQVLTIDDSRAMRTEIRGALEPSGYQVLEAEDGEDGLDKLRGLTQPVVVLVDYHMPNMTGVEMLEAVAREGAPLTRNEYLILSAHTTFPETLIDLLRKLSIRVLAKGLGDDNLVSAVQQAEERLQAPPADVIPDLPPEH